MSGCGEPVTDRSQRVRAVLEGHSLAGGIRCYDQTTGTAQAAADAVGCELGQIAKSIVFVADGVPLLAIVAGDRRGDAGAIAGIAGAREVKLADPATVLAATGYEVGSVSPFGLPSDMVVLIDESLQRFEIVLPAAGTSSSVVSLPLDRLIEITGGRVAGISR